jgi:hypothetical protein
VPAGFGVSFRAGFKTQNCSTWVVNGHPIETHRCGLKPASTPGVTPAQVPVHPWV